MVTVVGPFFWRPKTHETHELEEHRKTARTLGANAVLLRANGVLLRTYVVLLRASFVLLRASVVL